MNSDKLIIIIILIIIILILILIKNLYKENNIHISVFIIPFVMSC